VPVIMQYLHVRALVDEVALDSTRPDLFHWRWSPSGLYSASSAYQATFQGHTTLFRARELWKVEVPNKCHMFIWLVLQDRCWTAERRRRHGLQDDDDYAFCSQLAESIDHLLVGCPFSREVWFKCFRRIGWHGMAPTARVGGFALRWLCTRKRLRRDHRKCFNSIAVLVAWKLAGPREDFRGECSLSPTFLVYEITQDFELWCRADLIPRSSLPAS
jgi:hypothetical protein